jgi:uncharacterized protein with HEPN domain
MLVLIWDFFDLSRSWVWLLNQVMQKVESVVSWVKKSEMHQFNAFVNVD